MVPDPSEYTDRIKYNPSPYDERSICKVEISFPS